MSTYKEGQIEYKNDGGKIYKNGVVVPEANYKYIPTEVGGMRGVTPQQTAQQQTQQTTSNTQLGKYINNAPTPQYNFDAGSVQQASANDPKYDWYKQSQQDILGQLSSYKGDELSRIKSDTEQQISTLQAQLQNNKSKYEQENFRQSNQVNANYEAQNAEIDQQTYEQLDRANQMGAQRGISSSAQMRAMDNSINQSSTKLFNQNAQTRNQSLTDLASRLQSLNMELDNGFMTAKSGLLSAQSQQVGALNNTIMGKGIDIQQNTTQNLLGMMEKDNDRFFSSAQDKAKAQLQIDQSRYELGAKDAGMLDEYDRQMATMAKQFANQKELMAYEQQFKLQLMAKEQAFQRSMASAKAKAEEDAGKLLIPNDYGVAKNEWNGYVQMKLTEYEKSGMPVERMLSQIQADAYAYYGRGSTQADGINTTNAPKSLQENYGNFKQISPSSQSAPASTAIKNKVEGESYWDWRKKEEDFYKANQSPSVTSKAIQQALKIITG